MTLYYTYTYMAHGFTAPPRRSPPLVVEPCHPRTPAENPLSRLALPLQLAC